MDKTVEITGIPIDNVTYDDVLGFVDRQAHSRGQSHIVTVNPEMILQAAHDTAFHDLLRNATLRTPDGVGVLWAAHYFQKPKLSNAFLSRLEWLYSLFSILLRPNKIREPFLERVTGTDLMKRIVKGSQTHPWTLFLLGARDGVAEQVIRTLSIAYPQAKFVGFFAGSPKVEAEDEIVRRIHVAQPNILFVAYGSPTQEFWIQRNLVRLPSVRVAIGVGGAFDFHAGKISRAPLWMQKSGLEWLWRLFREPRRLGRVWNAAIVFSGLVYRKKRGGR